MKKFKLFLAGLLLSTVSCFSQSDLCSGATVITPGTTCVNTSWSIPQSFGNELASPSCATSTRDGWFQFTATATTATITATNSNRDMGLAIYSGTTCVAGNFVAGSCADAVNGAGTETTAITTTIGQVYKIRVMRTNTGANAMAGNICVTIPATPPANDQCGGATSVSCGGTYLGSTNLATSTNDPTGTCGTSAVTPGVWYVFPGNGNTVTASLCGSGYDTKIQVYSGTCASMSCVTGNDDYCSTQSQVTWAAATGINYYIFVGGYASATGSYSLVISCVVPAPPNCAVYTTPSNGSVLTCASTNLTWNAPASGGTPTQYLLFFGTDAAATNINNGTNIGNVLAYSPTSLLPNTTYYWKIVPQNGAGSATGCSTYSFTTGPAAVSNDLCSGATPLISGVTLSDDNTCAGDEPPLAVASCWNTGSVNSLWYSINVTGGTLGIITTSGTLVNTQIAVYNGGCASPTQVACNDDAPGPGCSATATSNSQLNLTGLANGTYYIRVDGRSSNVGSFSIMATTTGSVGTALPIPGQDCTSPIAFCSNPTVIGNPGYQNTGNVCDFGSGGNCTSGEKNAMWIEMTVLTPGSLAFNIIPNDYGGGCDNETDYDWVLFKSVGTGATTCANILSTSGDGEVACNYNYLGVTGMSTTGNSPANNSSGFPIAPGAGCYNASYETSVTAALGDKFLLVVQNFSGSTSGFSLTIPSGLGLATISTSPPPQVIWTGGANTTSVTNTTNWGGCAIPNCGLPGADAIVAASATVQPVVAANLSVKSVTINPGATLTINANIKLDVCGDFVNNGNLVCAPGSTINFNGSGTQIVSGNLTGANEFSNFMVTKSSGTVSLLNNVTTGQDFITTSAGSIVNTNGVSITVGRDFRNSNGSTTFTGITASSYLIFNGTGAQVYNPNMNAATPTLTLNNVTMLNTGSGVTISATNNPNMILGTTGVLTLTSGKIITNTEEVILENTANTAVTAGNTSSYVEGNLRRYLAAGATGSFDFPVGHATPGYERANLNFGTAAAAGALQLVGRFDPWGGAWPMPGAPGFGPECSVTYNDPYLNHGYWTINASATSTGNYTMTLYNRSYSNATSGWSIAKSPSASPAWALQGNCFGTPVTAVQRLNMSGFSRFSIVQSSVPLPVELIEFNGESKGSFNYVYWRSVSESNLDHYDLESSADGISFQKITQKAAVGIAGSQNYYSFDDYAYYNPVTYYRLKMMDHDLSYKYSHIISIENITKETPDVTIFPNPATNEINVQIKAPGQSKADIKITDMLGQVLFYKTVDLLNAMETFTINTSHYSEGSYVLTVSYVNNAPVSKKLVITRRN